MRRILIAATLLFIAGCDGGNVSQKTPSPQQTTAPAPAPVQPQEVKPKEVAASDAPSAEAKANFNQAFSYIGSAKAAATQSAKEKLFQNAEVELTNALEKSPRYVEALFNRGVVYMALGKLNKAEEDLKKAISIDGKSSAAHYNLACLYSVMNKQDLAADSLNAALQNGFTSIDSLRDDPDLSGLRKTKEFRQVLEKNKIFIK